MEPSQVLRSLSQITMREICHVFILLMLVTVGSTTAILEILIGFDLTVNEKSTLEALLGVSNSILQTVFTIEKLMLLHRVMVTIGEPLRTPAAPLDPELQVAGPLSRSASATLTMRMISSPASPAPPSRFFSAVSVQHED